ncbi:hypothetical protein D3C72_1417040 [compost metagenome]
MPAGAKISIGSMKAEPMMPNMSVTPLAARVSTNASEGVIFCGPVGMAAAAAAFWSVMSFMGVSWSVVMNCSVVSNLFIKNRYILFRNLIYNSI